MLSVINKVLLLIIFLREWSTLKHSGFVDLKKHNLKFMRGII